MLIIFSFLVLVIFIISNFNMLVMRERLILSFKLKILGMDFEFRLINLKKYKEHGIK